MVYAQPKICPSEWDEQTRLGYRDTNGSPNLGQTTRSYNNQQQKICRIVDFAVLADYRVTLKEFPCKEIEKAVEHESDDNTNSIWCSWYSQQRISTKTGGLGCDRTSGDHPNCSIIEMSLYCGVQHQ